MALGDNFRKASFDVNYLITGQYAKLGGDSSEMHYLPMGLGVKGLIVDTFNFLFKNEFRTNLLPLSPDLVFFYNPHPLNPMIARLLRKKFPSATFVLYLHDPYKPEKRPYGTVKAGYITIVEFIQKLTVKYMDIVISPSAYSSSLFKEYYRGFNGRNQIAPLLVPDQRCREKKCRKYFSMVGTAHQATGHDIFVGLVNYVAAEDLAYEFVLVSSSNISVYLEKLTGKAKKILKVINKEIITDAEINNVISQSLGVFRLDSEVTQSGVIPVAFMNDTPVIVRDIPGLVQHVKHGANGYILPYDCTPENCVEAMQFVMNNFSNLSKIARESYEEVWAEWNWGKYYGWLKELIQKGT
ncbi:MAG: glycosyltransferase [Thermodesulfovibrionales bacterium]